MSSPLPTSLTVVVPALDPVAALDVVTRLAECWPDDARLVLAGPLGDRARRVLAVVEGDVELVEVPGCATFGEAVRGGARGVVGPVLVVEPATAPASEDLARAVLDRHDVAGTLLADAAELAATPALDTARTLSALVALVRASRRRSRTTAAPALRSAHGVPGRVSVVVQVLDPAGPATRVCLEALHRHAPADLEVVLVDHGPPGAAVPAKVRHLPAPDGAPDERYAVGANAGIEASTGDVVVLLDVDTVVTRFWAEGLVRALADADAAGPRSTAALGAQHADALGPLSAGGLREAVDSWRRAHRGQVTASSRLSGACLALRRSALAGAGLLDAGLPAPAAVADLLSRVLAGGGRGVVADEVLVSHQGLVLPLAARPALSAALIVRDEEELLPGCLDALVGLVDEIIVCDTGSTDRTVEVARTMGAVVTGFAWVDDFAAARNAAVGDCSGTWVLAVDADEVLVCDDPAALIGRLAGTGVDALTVEIRSLEDGAAAAGYAHYMERVLRPERVRFHAPLHEHLVHRDGGGPPAAERLVGAHLLHSGYAAGRVTDRDKLARNTALAEAAFAAVEGSPEDPRHWAAAFELGRILHAADDPRAAELLDLAVRAMPAAAVQQRAVARTKLAALALGSDDLALAEQHARGALTDLPGYGSAALTLSVVLSRSARDDEALEVLTSFRPGGHNLLELHLESVSIPCAAAALELRLGRSARAWDRLVAVLHTPEQSFLDWPLLLQVATTLDPDGWADRLAAAAGSQAPALLLGLASLPAPACDRLADALVAVGVDLDEAHPDRARARQVERATAGHSDAVLARVAADTEATDPAVALELWHRVEPSPARAMGLCRCLLALSRADDALGAVDGVDLAELEEAERVLVAALALQVGDTGRAHDALAALAEPPAEVLREARALAALIGPRTVALLEPLASV